MNTVLFNHPHRDSYSGGILVPLRIEEGHHGTDVVYRMEGEDFSGIMSLNLWTKYCKPVMFDKQEGA